MGENSHISVEFDNVGTLIFWVMFPQYSSILFE